jgi:hypothetical protein
MTMDVDEHANAAARELQTHVAARLDGHDALARVGARQAGSPRRRPMAIAAGIVAVLACAAAITFVVRAGDDEQVRVDTDEHPSIVPAAPGTPRTPEARQNPDDGLNSVGLPITVDPPDGLADGQEVTVTGTGFVPAEQVGLVMCVRQPEGVNAGQGGCDLTLVSYAVAGADGTVTATFTVRRVITTEVNGTVDCAEAPNRCSIGMGAIENYDRSGGTTVSFDPSIPPLPAPTFAVEPSTGVVHGQVVHVSGDGFFSDVYLGQCTADGMWCAGIGTVPELDGHVESDVTVWRYLPGPSWMPVDCAASPGACVLTASPMTNGSADPNTVPLTFDASGGGRPLPSISAVPTGSTPPDGASVTIVGQGFQGSSYLVLVCSDDINDPSSCRPADLPGGGISVTHPLAADGTMRVDIVLHRDLPLVVVTESSEATTGPVPPALAAAVFVFAR